MTFKAIGVTAVALATLASSAAFADDNGVAETLHSVRKERGIKCMIDHYHYGSSGQQATKAKAQKEAIVSWQSFTAFEYGTDWARYNKAGSKKMSCTQGSSWECSVEGRPCK